MLSKFVCTLFCLSLTACKQQPFSDDASQFLSEPLVQKVVERVRDDYVDKPDEEKMSVGALNGMLMALDPYSAYMDEKTYLHFSEMTNGRFVGIGIEIAFVDGALKVIAPIEDMPAERAGIQSGDVITHVNDKQIAGMPPIEVIEMIHGKPGTVVQIRLIRETSRDPISLKIERAYIPLNPVKYKVIRQIGYIRLTHFNEKADSKLKEAIEAMKRELGDHLKGVVLDLRNNPGGTLDQAIAVANLFIKKSMIVQVKGRNTENNRVYNADGHDLLDGVPLGTLVNQGSASASEIIAAVVKDSKRGIVLGTKTFGKGSVQAVYRFRGMGAVKLTVAKFYTPNGDVIQDKGVTPDVEIVIPQKQWLDFYLKKEKRIKPWARINVEEDPQVHRAIQQMGKGRAGT